MSAWHIITPEYPPECGGVGDYTAQVAAALQARGERVVLHTPTTLPDRFGARTIAHLDAVLDAEPAPARLLVQYVANVFGLRGANMPFVSWLSRRAERDDLRIMIHEPYLYFRWRPDHVAVALAQRSMARIVVRSARHLYLSTEAWREYLWRFAPEQVAAATVLPIPSAIPCVDAPEQVREIRQRLVAANRQLIGHFGTYGDHIAPMLEATFQQVLASQPDVHAICLGRGAAAFARRFNEVNATLGGRVHAPAVESPEQISLHLQAVHALVQPYPDGATTRRTSLMAGLANGCAVVTNAGTLSEPVWGETEAVALADAPDPHKMAEAVRALLLDEAARVALGRRAQATYRDRFDLAVTINVLLADAHALA